MKQLTHFCENAWCYKVWHASSGIPCISPSCKDTRQDVTCHSRGEFRARTSMDLKRLARSESELSGRARTMLCRPPDDTHSTRHRSGPPVLTIPILQTCIFPSISALCHHRRSDPPTATAAVSEIMYNTCAGVQHEAIAMVSRWPACHTWQEDLNRRVVVLVIAGAQATEGAPAPREDAAL